MAFCMWCGAEFEAKNRNAIIRRFCDDPCREAANTKARQIGMDYMLKVWTEARIPLRELELTMHGQK